jgi:hypothetical protein
MIKVKVFVQTDWDWGSRGPYKIVEETWKKKEKCSQGSTLQMSNTLNKVG